MTLKIRNSFLIARLYYRKLFRDLEKKLIMNSSVKKDVYKRQGYESPSARALLRIALYSGDSDIIVRLIFARQSALSVSAPKQIEADFIVLSVRTAPLAKFSALDNA